MIYFLLVLIFNVAYADPTWRWATAVEIVEKHEFYGNNEMISKPAGSWEVLFGITYNDANLEQKKDCVMFRVPGKEPGILKIKSVALNEPCEKYLYETGDEEWKNLKALQFKLQPQKLSLHLTHANFKTEDWEISLFNVQEKPELKPLLSSAEYRSRHIIYLAPQKNSTSSLLQKPTALQDKAKCHNISDKCEELSSSTCGQCPLGWYEIPNGCPQGPKYCGVLNCGGKNQPACRRGMTYQRVRKKFECWEDSSFAYCSKGFKILCQGSEAYCI